MYSSHQFTTNPDSDNALHNERTVSINALKVTSWMGQPIVAGDDSVDTVVPSGETRTLIARYRLDDLIAEGGFAQVWRAYDLKLQRFVAIKVPKPSRLQSADAFMAEAHRVARLKHPGIVPVFDVGREGDFCFIVSEFVEGGSLGEHLVNNPLSQQQAIRWIIEIAEALEYAHLPGVVHRDVKPGNILIDHHNRALLADFGFAQSANKARRLRSARVEDDPLEDGDRWNASPDREQVHRHRQAGLQMVGQ